MDDYEIVNVLVDSLCVIGGNILLIIDDQTRTTPVKQILPLLDEVILRGNVDIMFAYGTHRHMDKHEIVQKIGESPYCKYDIYHHDWKDEENLVYIGFSDVHRIPIWVNKNILDYDVVITIGSIIPHATSGFSGGPKLICPGVCGEKTLSQLHWKATWYKMKDILGVHNNDIMKEIKSIERRIREYAGFDHYIVNAIPSPKSPMSKLIAGQFNDVFYQYGCSLSKDLNKVVFEKQTDNVIAFADKAHNLRQAVKAICTADIICKDGGTIYLVADCYEGVSPQFPEFEKIGFRHWKELWNLIETGAFEEKKLLAYTLVVIGEILSRKRVVLVTDQENISTDLAWQMGLERSDPRKREIQKIKGNVLHNACSVLPVIGEK